MKLEEDQKPTKNSFGLNSFCENTTDYSYEDCSQRVTHSVKMRL